MDRMQFYSWILAGWTLKVEFGSLKVGASSSAIQFSWRVIWYWHPSFQISLSEAGGGIMCFNDLFLQVHAGVLNWLDVLRCPFYFFFYVHGWTVNGPSHSFLTITKMMIWKGNNVTLHPDNFWVCKWVLNGIMSLTTLNLRPKHDHVCSSVNMFWDLFMNSKTDIKDTSLFRVNIQSFWCTYYSIHQTPFINNTSAYTIFKSMKLCITP